MMSRHVWPAALVLTSTLLAAAPASAQTGAASTEAMLRELREEVAAMRAEQERSKAQLRDADARIAALEERLRAAAAQSSAAPVVVAAPQAATDDPEPHRPGERVAPATLAATDAPRRADPLRGFDVGGDIRVRYEDNFGEEKVRNRARGVIRARLRAGYAVDDWLSVGGQLVTGDPDDPNSSDLGLGNFDDDFDFSLDQAYVQARFGRLTLLAGKFVNPVERTEMVWDGDVNPQGLGASYRLPLGTRSAIRLNGLFFLIDERTGGPDSAMLGGQAAFTTKLGDTLQLGLSGAYYDYRLHSLAGGDAGDFRSNLLAPGGLAYLSDFNLVNAIASAAYTGLGERWPVTLTGDYVRNLGAATDADTGHSGAVTIGRTARRGDLRFGYSYMSVDTDAVFAAFSHDNLNLATNYVMHGLSGDYVVFDRMILNATYYRYRVKDPAGPGSGVPGDWRDRLRLNLLVNF